MIKMEDKEYLDREQVLNRLWCLIPPLGVDNQIRSAYALAYCDIRAMSFHSEFTLKEELRLRKL